MSNMTQHMDNAFAVSQQLTLLKQEAGKRFLEREVLLNYFMPTLLAGQHGLLLGVPGVAKTAVIRWVTESMQLEWFWYTLDSDTNKEDLIGTYSVKGLQDDKFTRVWAGLATAHIALLDEPGKAPNSVLNMLLTALNERQGQTLYEHVPFPLHSLWAGSNEMFDDNAAIYDRFHVRIPIEDVTNPDNFWSVLTGDSETPIDCPVDPAHLKSCRIAADHLRQQATGNKSLYEALMLIKAEAKKLGVEHTSRRWKESLRIAAGNALLHKRTSIQPEDLIVLGATLWTAKETYEPLRVVIAKIADRESIEIEQFVSELDRLESQLTGDGANTKKTMGIVMQIATLHNNYKNRGARWQPYLDRAKAIFTQYMVT